MIPTTASIGNLLTTDIDECYNSEFANKLRASIENQSFLYCRKVACPHLQNDNLEDISPEEYERRKSDHYRPTIINLAHDYICNQSCETCRSKVYVPIPDYPKNMELIRKRIEPYLDTAVEITASGHGDPFASKYMMDILANIKPKNKDLVILLETNGVFFDEDHWKRIEHFKDCHLKLVITANSFNRFTYEHISKGGNFDKLLVNFAFAAKLRKAGHIKELINSIVIQDRNFREIPEFCKRSFDDFTCDVVVLKPVYQWGKMSDEAYWFKDVLNPMHPYHQEYLEIMQDPIVKSLGVFNFAGDTTHEARPYPGITGTNDGPEDCVTCGGDDEAAFLRSKVNEYELKFNEQKQRIDTLNNAIDNQINDLEQKICDLHNSTSWKIGRMITAIPRKLNKNNQ
jgi:hypothetical protein